jgi:hypothetical protein
MNLLACSRNSASMSQPAGANGRPATPSTSGPHKGDPRMLRMRAARILGPCCARTRDLSA